MGFYGFRKVPPSRVAQMTDNQGYLPRSEQFLRAMVARDGQFFHQWSTAVNQTHQAVGGYRGCRTGKVEKGQFALLHGYGVEHDR